MQHNIVKQVFNTLRPGFITREREPLQKHLSFAEDFPYRMPLTSAPFWLLPRKYPVLLWTIRGKNILGPAPVNYADLPTCQRTVL